MSVDLKSWVKTKSDELAWDQGCRPDLAAALKVRRFFERLLKHSKGQWAGQPFELLPWQWDDFLKPLFGWKQPDGLRRFRRAGCWIPKKNGKSTLASGIILYMLFEEPGAECYSAAADREQASIVFNEAANMVRASPHLARALSIVPSTKRIVLESRAAWFRALSAEVSTKEGLNAQCIVFDELHAQKKRELWESLTYAGAARRQPLLLSISTAGFDRDTIGYEQYQYAKDILDGRTVDIGFFGFIREAAVDDDWTSPAVWQKANPSLGATIRVEDLQAACLEAQNSPSKQNAFRRYRLNQWTEQDVRWLAIDRWDACGQQPIDLAHFEGAPCFAGLDLASTTDVAALALLFPTPGGFVVFLWFWVPEEAARERERKNRVRLTDWIRAGLIEATPGDVIDFDRIRERIKALGLRFRILKIGVDRWNATQLSTQLQGDGFDVEGFGQGFASMSGPTKELEALILSGKLLHGGNAVLRWMAGNVAVEQDAAGNLKPSKRRSTEKIDGIVAVIEALGLAMQHPIAGDPTVDWW